MKKWVGPLLSLLLITGMVSISLSPNLFNKKTNPEQVKSEDHWIALAQEEKEKGESDPHLILILKEVQKKLAEWLKSLNERIESEDITRFEVRFLEMIRNILEWIKEKVDAKIESSEQEKPIKKERRGVFRETHHTDLPFLKL